MLYFPVCVFFIGFSNISKTPLFRTFVCDDFYKFNWERFHSNYSRFYSDSTTDFTPDFSQTLATTDFTPETIPDFSKIVSFHVELATKCIQTSRKEKFHKQPLVILFKNDCSAIHMFCTIFASLSVARSLEKHFRSSS